MMDQMDQADVMPVVDVDQRKSDDKSVGDPGTASGSGPPFESKEQPGDPGTASGNGLPFESKEQPILQLPDMLVDVSSRDSDDGGSENPEGVDADNFQGQGSEKSEDVGNLHGSELKKAPDRADNGEDGQDDADNNSEAEMDTDEEDLDSADELQQQAEMDAAEKMAKARLDKLKRWQSAKNTEMNKQMQNAQRTRETRDANRAQLLKTCGIDKNSMRAVQCRTRMRGLVSLMFFVVITGCELDLLGFAGAWKDYWDLNVVFSRIFLVVMPCVYLIVAFKYYRDNLRNESNSINVKPYHFLPLCRYLLLVKTLQAEDIEAIFRVNTLSSFTLGTAQLVSFVFANVSGVKWSIFIYINIASFIINWTITFLFFMTKISKSMQHSIKIRAYKFNLGRQFQDDLKELEKMVREDAEKLSEKIYRRDLELGHDSASSAGGSSLNSDEEFCNFKTLDAMTKVGQFRAKNISEIQHRQNNLELDMTLYTPIEILSIRRLLCLAHVDKMEK